MRKSQQEVIDQAHYQQSVKDTMKMVNELTLSVRKLDEMERQRQYDAFEVKRRLQASGNQKATDPSGKPGSHVVTEELDDANRRFSQLASIILERRNEILTLNQNWKRRQQVRHSYNGVFFGMFFMTNVYRKKKRGDEQLKLKLPV